ncbi:NADH dehydrogenase [ubiquinone] 1 alpha subcomplex subunit 5 [Contarinia nasturtii]|uniref:NADH dehydrogenase [ubiquinone] 1 alpha subcomplex subunit 5 n=1 Tax=Contarinia nasturtii TaxID=265458 RepID=UPI0012D4137D|nr:NADH dehydrogenase [ubiquinone] 1 alpha subcomplex subunit 5 [Contarinia nasturtii]
MSGAVKKLSTGLTGLVVSKNPHHQLASLYGKTLRALAQMPETAAYRVNTEKIIRERAHIVATTQNAIDIEKKIGCGQIEELIVQAENELLLSRKFLSWKPWEPLARQAPPSQWTWPPAKISPQS